MGHMPCERLIVCTACVFASLGERGSAERFLWRIFVGPVRIASPLLLSFDFYTRICYYEKNTPMLQPHEYAVVGRRM